MDKFTATFLLAVGAIYSDLDSDNLFYNFVLPALLVGSLLYLFSLKAFLALAGAALAYHYMDLTSQSFFSGLLMPLLFGICLLFFMLWSGLGRYAGGGDGGGDFGDFGGFGGDGGGDGGGGD